MLFRSGSNSNDDDESFRYEKLTSTYWIDFMESFLWTTSEEWQQEKLEQQEVNGITATDIMNKIQNAVQDYSDTAATTTIADDHFHESSSGGYSLSWGDHVLKWESFLIIKMAGVALIVMAVRRYEYGSFSSTPPSTSVWRNDDGGEQLEK